MSPAAMKTGSRLSWLVMLSTENCEMLSQLLVWISGSCQRGERKGAGGGVRRPFRGAVPAAGCRTHLHLQLHDVVHGPRLVVVVVVGDGGEAAGPLLVADAALGEVLGRAGAADAVFGDPRGHICGVEIVTFKYFNVD